MQALRLFLLISVVIASLGFQTGPVSAQDTTATSQLSGMEIDIGDSGEATIVDTSPEPSDEWGYLQEDFLIKLHGGEIHISFVQGDVTPELWYQQSHEHLAPNFDTYEILDESISMGQSWSITRETYLLNYQVLTYSEFYFHDVDDISLSVTVHSSEETVISNILWARENVLVGGDPVAIIANVDYLEELIGGEADVSPQSVPGYSSTLADWENVGLVSETEWRSPNFGTSISWDGSLWEFPWHRSTAILAENDGLQDVVTLMTPDRRGLAYVYTMENHPGVTAVDWLDWFQADEYLETLETDLGTTIEIIDAASTENTASAILYMTDQFGNTLALILNVYLDDQGQGVSSFIFAAPDDIADVYQAYWDGVMADGNLYPLTWHPDEIVALRFPE